MTDIDRFIKAWPLPWTRRGSIYYASLSGDDWLSANELTQEVQVMLNGSFIAYGPMPGVLLTVKKALLEEAFALRQRLAALDEALSLLNVDGE